MLIFNQSSTTILPENIRKRKCSDVFREYRSGTSVENKLKKSIKDFLNSCKLRATFKSKTRLVTFFNSKIEFPNTYF